MKRLWIGFIFLIGSLSSMDERPAASAEKFSLEKCSEVRTFLSTDAANPSHGVGEAGGQKRAPSESFLQGKFSAEAAEEKPVVMTTIQPYSYLVERIAGEFVCVKTVVPPHANAHLFEPAPKDLDRFHEARLWIRMGEGFENLLITSLVKHNPGLIIFEAWQGLPLLTLHGEEAHSGCCGHWDRHIWLSPRQLMRQMPLIAEAVSSICPEHRAEIAERLRGFLEELKGLDERLSALFSNQKGRTILVAHPSFGYFCQDYGLTQLSIEQEGKEPLPKQLQELFVKVRNQPLRYLFVQPQFSVRGAKQVADKLSLSLYTIDPYAYDYLRILEEFAKAIAQE